MILCRNHFSVRSLAIILFLFSVTVLFGVVPAKTSDSGEAETIYTEDIYWRNWYAPPPDWRAGVPIAKYNLNTRIPELIWVNYEGANTSGLRIRPIAKQRVEEQIAAGLISVKTNPTALEFNPALEKDTKYRTVSIKGLNVDASDMVGVSFKMKGPGNLKFTTGLGGVIDTANEKFLDKNVKCEDGFKAYRLDVKARPNTRLTGLSITVDPVEKLDQASEYIIIDLVYHYANKQPYVKDIAPRKWAINDGDKEIGGVYAYMNSAPKDAGVEVLDLPLTRWAPRDPAKDGGVKVEQVTEKIDGKEVPAIRFTFKAGPSGYWISPIAFNPEKFNTMSFLYKVEVPKGAKVTGAQRPPDWGYAGREYHAYADNVGVSYLSETKDVVDWNGGGISRAGTAFMKQNEPAPEGWNVFAWDNKNDEQLGAKDFDRETASHWVIYYHTKNLKEGEEVVFTLANPKVATGIIRTGGDMAKFKEFKKEFAKLKYDFSDSSKYLEAPLEGRLPEPLQIMKSGVFGGEIVLAGWTPQAEIRQKAAEELQYLIKLVCAPVTDVPIVKQPTEFDNVKIFLGPGAFDQKFLTPEQKKSLKDDFEALKGTAGCAIRTFGKNIFIFGGNFEYRPNNGNYPGPERGTLNGVYEFMENNTDLIFAGYNIRKGRPSSLKEGCNYVFSRPKDGNWSIVWGNGLTIPPDETYTATGVDSDYASRTRSNFLQWHFNADEMKLGFRRHNAVNHFFGFGAGTKKPDGGYEYKTPNPNWGIGEDGKPMPPGCYTGHPCLLNVLEDAKDHYVTRGYDPLKGVKIDAKNWQASDKIALWLEDTQKICVCPKCTTPIRLPSGELVKSDETDFRSTQFFAQTNAMIQAYNVYVQPDQYVEPIIYFFESCIPRGPLSAMIRPKICPYIRKNYKEPIYAPVNDTFWRNYVRWSQLTGSKLSQYEYFLGVNFRPFADVNQYDLKAVRDLGVIDFVFEGQSKTANFMERWVLGRQGWLSDADPMELRKYYIRRTYHEAAPEMEKFYFTLHKLYYDDPLVVEFEEDEFRMPNVAHWSRSKKNPNITVAEELTGYLDTALEKVKNPLAKEHVIAIRTEWQTLLDSAKKVREKADEAKKQRENPQVANDAEKKAA